ncbi:hypothetical protein Pyn_40048 [Prunus yedoensis var. nudiflora]|uniref:Uncharacterized protein n=1 Tax=Prunus yedoensis var. nudiflora TaxID=2094558 RepID=A0A314U9N8_PRUYE|nr:hypothetical protein Pyn_40048 [Prunus yedoensis var. nudiflora]
MKILDFLLPAAKMERRFYNFLFGVLNIEAEHCRSLQEAIRCKGVMFCFEKFDDCVKASRWDKSAEREPL